MLQHSDAVTDTDPKGTSRSAFPDHDADDRRRKLRHLQDAGRNELRLASFLGPDTGIRTGRVNQADNRNPELGRQLHLAQCLPVPLGMCAPVKALLSFRKVPTLLVTDQHDLEIAEPREASADRPVVAESPVPMQLDELIERQ